MHPSTKYRPEIDGLRALAVSLVVVYHANFIFQGSNLVSFGFLGVDVFFVISGYLIASIIVSSSQNSGRFQFLRFFDRRARRLVPVLLVVSVFTLIVSYALLLPTDLQSVSESIEASLAFSSNLLFRNNQVFYGGPEALDIPFLHTWSLAIEGQFYVVFACIAAVLASRFYLLFSCVVLVCVCSIGLLFFFDSADTQRSFYSLDTRIWEPFVGTLPVIMARVFDLKLTSRTTTALSGLGLILLILAFALVGDQTKHPGSITLLAVVGTSCCLVGFERKSIFTRFFSFQPLVWLGLISYGLYLWHYPILSFSHLIFGEMTPTIKILAILVSVVLSVLTYFYVEKPFRNGARYSFRQFSVCVLFIAAGILAVSEFIKTTNGAPFRLSAGLRDVVVGEKIWNQLSQNGAPCFSRIDNFCTFPGPPGSTTVIALGDSHFAALSPDLYSRIKDRYSYIDANYGGCPFLLGMNLMDENGAQSEHCSSDFQNKRKALLEGDPKIILMGGRYQLYFSETFFNNGVGGIENGARRWKNFVSLKESSLAAHLRETIQHVLDLGHYLVFVNSIPEAGWDVPQKLHLESVKKKLGIEGDTDNRLSTDMTKYLDRANPAMQVVAGIAHPRLLTVNPANLLCDRETQKCFVDSDGQIFYVDHDHMSQYGAKLINDLILDSFPQ